MKIVYPVSYSSWSYYTDCPKKYHYNYILKCKQPSTFALEKGNTWHKNCEVFIKEENTDLIDKLEIWRVMLTTLKHNKAFAEQRMAVNEKMQPLPWRSKDSIVRWIIDARYYDENTRILKVIDFKTGKEYPNHTEQMEFYACFLYGVLKKEIPINKVVCELWYLDIPKIVTLTLSLDFLDNLRDHYLREFNEAKSVVDFPTTPSASACKWCPYSVKRRNTLTIPEGGYCQDYFK